MRRLLATAVLALAVAILPSAALAQDAGRLVIVRAGSSLEVGAEGVAAGSTVRFAVILDQVELADTFTVAAGATTTVKLPSITPGQHVVEVAATEPATVQGDRATFTTSGRFTPLALILAAVLVGLLVFYRRRVLEPFSRGRDRSVPMEGSEPPDRPTA